jgi:hypothetical protein
VVKSRRHLPTYALFLGVFFFFSACAALLTVCCVPALRPVFQETACPRRHRTRCALVDIPISVHTATQAPVVYTHSCAVFRSRRSSALTGGGGWGYVFVLSTPASCLLVWTPNSLGASELFPKCCKPVCGARRQGWCPGRCPRPLFVP